MKKTLTILCLLVAGMANAQHGMMTHVWQKQNETRGQDAYGNPVVICSWVCRADWNNAHFTQTQGSGYCPMPY